MEKKLVGVFVAALAVSVLIGGLTVLAIGYWMQSNQVTVNVSEQETLSLTTNKPSIIYGEEITLTAIASDGNVCAGVEVQFKEGGAVLATVAMNGEGVATYTFAPPVGSHIYVAEAQHP